MQNIDFQTTNLRYALTKLGPKFIDFQKKKLLANATQKMSPRKALQNNIFLQCNLSAYT